jgi:hypothetical protein
MKWLIKWCRCSIVLKIFSELTSDFAWTVWQKSITQLTTNCSSKYIIFTTNNVPLLALQLMTIHSIWEMKNRCLWGLGFVLSECFNKMCHSFNILELIHCKTVFHNILETASLSVFNEKNQLMYRKCESEITNLSHWASPGNQNKTNFQKWDPEKM